MVLIAGFGNPLLDITVQIRDDKLLKKYNLLEDDQQQMIESDIKSLLIDISTLPASYSPGGSCQNTLRILQWLLMKPSTVMFGGIGEDQQGNDLKKLVQDAGVDTRYIVHKNISTGTAAALVNGPNRSLVAYLGAAEIVSVNDLNQEATIKFLQKVDLIYMEAYFLTDRADTGRFIEHFCAENNKTLVFNLSAPYMANREPESIQFFARKSDILFGNYKEFYALSEIMNLNMNPQQLVQYLCETYDGKRSQKYGKLIVITNGSKNVSCAHNGGIIEEVDVPKLKLEEIGDTTGAGDAFVAGFLAGYFAEQEIKTCLQWGCWVARQIIKQVGCVIPKEFEFLDAIRLHIQKNMHATSKH